LTRGALRSTIEQMSGDVPSAEPAGWTQRVLAGLCVLGGCMVLGSWLLPKREAHAAIPVQVQVAGETVDLNADPSDTARRLAQRYLEQPLVLEAAGLTQTSTRESLGVRVDREHLAALLKQAADGASALRRVHAQALGRRPLALPMPAELDPARSAAFVLRLKDNVDRAPIEPRVEPRKQLVIAAQPGLELDMFGTFDRIEDALVSGSPHVQAALSVIPTKLATRAFAGLDMHAVLGEFETRYNRANISEDRTHNLKTAALKIDGFVLAPDAVFDFNAIVGGRTLSNGFRAAPVIADGELVDGMGGGTCQVASTLHAAVLFAGLPILTRFPHSRPSFYIKLGLDATVVDGAQNFRFKNDRPYPIVIGLTVDEGRVYASLHGPTRDHNVTFIRHIDATLPFEERVIEDRSLPSGLRVLSQRGVPGFKITRFRIVSDETTHVSVRERSQDSYPPTAQLWRVGTGREPPAGFERPRNDPHPEYIADEHLQMTQTEAGTYDVARDSGRTGSYGWIERERLLVRKD
jgi:vancomycin resistance protein YoaR